MESLDRLKSALADRYAVERQIGAGGMADVYLTHDLRHNRKVAIKVMHRDLAELVGVERFLREIETTAKLQHPHILPLFDSGSIDGTVFYVMPYVEGESLRSRLKKDTQLPIADALRITSEIATGLGYAHRHGVIHRDIKPDNVLFQDGQAVLADFGISLPNSDNHTTTRLTQAGISLGTPAYMSPEQVTGQEVDRRSDIYALGAVVYEMLAGQPPFTGSSLQAVLSRVISEDPRPLGEHRKSVPPHVAAAIAKALEKLPADRWQSASEFIDALTNKDVYVAARTLQSKWTLIPWVLAAALAIALGWVGLRTQRADVRSGGIVRFGVDFANGVVPSFTPIVRLSADGRQLFVSAMVDRREEVLRHTLDRVGMEVIKGAGQGGRSGGTRITAEGGRDFGAEWTPDGKQLIYSSERPFFDLYRRAADATQPAEALLSESHDHYNGSVSRDGKLVAFSVAVPGGEIWTMPLQGATTATQYFANGFNLGHPTLSPDGRWMAYDSDESGQGVDIFIQSFPDPRVKRVKVSPAHGSEPMWTQGGRELVYREGDKVMAVTVDLATGAIGPPQVLFSGPYPDNPGWTRPRSYDVTPDGQRFLLTKLPGERPQPRIMLVLNWFDELRARVPR